MSARGSVPSGGDPHARHAAIARRFVGSAAPGRAVGQNGTLVGEDGGSLLVLRWRRIVAGQQAGERSDAKTVHPPNLPRQLIVVSAMLDDQGAVDEVNRRVTCDAQPQVVVLACRKTLIEASD